MLNCLIFADGRCFTLDNGKLEYYDEFSSEPDCAAFKGLHSKCYGVVNEAYVNKKGEHMPRELKNAKITHVSYVDRAANKKKFFLMKAKKKQPDTY